MCHNRITKILHGGDYRNCNYRKTYFHDIWITMENVLWNGSQSLIKSRSICKPFGNSIILTNLRSTLPRWPGCPDDNPHPPVTDVIKWKHFPRYWPFVRGIHRSPVNSPHKGQWPGALMFSLIWVWINGWVNIREAGDLRRHRAHYDVIAMSLASWQQLCRLNENIGLPTKFLLHIILEIRIYGKRH